MMRTPLALIHFHRNESVHAQLSSSLGTLRNKNSPEESASKCDVLNALSALETIITVEMKLLMLCCCAAARIKRSLQKLECL